MMYRSAICCWRTVKMALLLKPKATLVAECRHGSIRVWWMFRSVGTCPYGNAWHGGRMKEMLMRKSLVVIAAASCVISVPAAAADVIVGGGSTANAFPFAGCAGTCDQYQQVYNSNQFAAPVLISAIRFVKGSGGSTLAGGTYTLSASTTSAAVDGLSSDFASNIGADNTTVFSGTLAPNFNGSVLRFVFSTPFQYNPAAGNLLLNFAVAGFTAPNESVFFLSQNTINGITSRQHNFGSATAGFGLQTTFETSPIAAGVPEPATWALMLLGFFTIGAAIRARKPVVSTTVSYA